MHTDLSAVDFFSEIFPEKNPIPESERTLGGESMVASIVLRRDSLKEVFNASREKGEDVTSTLPPMVSLHSLRRIT